MVGFGKDTPIDIDTGTSELEDGTGDGEPDIGMDGVELATGTP